MIKRIIDNLIFQCRRDTEKYPIRIVMGFNIRHQFYSELDMIEDYSVFTEEKYRGIPLQFELEEKSVRVEL